MPLLKSLASVASVAPTNAIAQSDLQVDLPEIQD